MLPSLVHYLYHQVIMGFSCDQRYSHMTGSIMNGSINIAGLMLLWIALEGNLEQVRITVMALDADVKRIQSRSY